MAEKKKQKDQKVTIDGKEHNLADLSKEAQEQLFNLHGTEQEIIHLNRQLAIAKTAKNAYTHALSQEMAKKEVPKTH